MQGLSSQFGIINSLRTGNVILDMAVCMMIPLVFKILTLLFERFQPWINEIIESIRQNKNVCLKTLDYEFRMNAWGSVHRAGKEERNNILQKAITLYIAEIKDLKLENSKISFMAVKEKATRDNESYQMVYGGTVEQLQLYSISTLPQNNVWIELKPGLHFRQQTIEPNQEGENKITKNTIRFEFKGDNPDGQKKVDSFIQDAFDWYVERMKAMQDHSRYLYMLVKSPPAVSSNEDGGGGDDAQTRVYKRYKLSDEKSFQCLFFREKQMLLKLLRHFKDKTGKYAIQGFPHKLGLLLHGPPGTGKTSLIKAMAQHTGRNVVSIPLARIETNQELMDIVFDQSFAVKGEDMPVKLSFKDIIFVMEDVDAASPIVHARSSTGKNETTKVTLEKKASVPGGGKEDESVKLTKEVSVVGGDGHDEGAEEKDGGDAGLVMAMLSSLADSGTSSEKKGLDYKASKYMSKYDKLDLSGLLNVLDGVVDCPNRILIMTTNHPEKLDPALIRPGRIDKIIYLGYLQAPEAKEMVEHYFKVPLTDEQWRRLETAMGSPPGVADMTPAEVEQLCAEYDDVDEFLSALEEKVLNESEKHFMQGNLKAGQSHYGNDNATSMPPPEPLRRGLSTTSSVHSRTSA